MVGRSVYSSDMDYEEIYRLNTSQSYQMNLDAQQYLPGGDSRSTIYYFPYPQFFQRGEGCYLYDADGNRFLDFTGNHTSLVLGYGHPEVSQAIVQQVGLGTCFPGATEPQIRLARLICERVPSVEWVRFTNSGTEATMNAIRAARAFTGRSLVVKAEGAFHGTHDIMEVSIAPNLEVAGTSNDPVAVPHVAGIPEDIFDQVIIVPFNDPEEAVRIIERHGSEVASIIVEPVLGAAGMIPATVEYLQALREVAEQVGALLIFDEVITFRLAQGGAQEYYDVIPDLTCFGKMIGGGLPLGAFGGGKEVMALFDPSSGPPSIHHGGSLNANPLSLVAGAATLEQLSSAEYDHLAHLGGLLRSQLQNLFSEMGVPAQVTGVGSLFAIHLTDREVNDYRDAQAGDKLMQQRLFLGLINEGVVMDPRGAGSLSLAIGEKEIESFIDCMRRVLADVNAQ